MIIPENLISYNNMHEENPKLNGIEGEIEKEIQVHQEFQQEPSPKISRIPRFTISGSKIFFK